MVISVIEVELLRRRNMVELPVMASCEQLDTVPHEVPIKLHKETYQCEIIGRNVTLQVLIVFIPERGVQ